VADSDSSNPDRAALGLDPARIMAAQRAHIVDALDSEDAEDASEAVRTYLDLEERIIVDMAERVVPEEELPSSADIDLREELLAEDNATAASRGRSRVLFDRHVRETDPLFRALWKHLDERQHRDLAAALEEARLSRDEAELDLPPRPDARPREVR